MNDNDDFIGKLEDYLEAFDGATPLPHRVRDAIRAELPSARQVQPRPGPLRVFTMLSNASAGARMGLAAAAVVAVVVLGAAVLNNNTGNGGIVGAAPTPTPPATTAPTTAPTPSTTPSASAAAGPLELNAVTYTACDAADTNKSCLPAGTYQLSRGRSTWPTLVTADVPAHWFEWEGGPGMDGILVAGGPPDYNGSGWGVVFTTVGDVSRDPCNTAKGSIPAAQVGTPQKLAAAMAAWPKFKATSPQPITVDGHPGVKFVVTSTAGSSCSPGMTWLTTSGFGVDAYPMTSDPSSTGPGTFEIVDTGHGLLVMRYTDYPKSATGGSATEHAADLPKLHALIDSVRITDWPASS